MIILGIDQGLANSGYSILELKENKKKYKEKTNLIKISKRYVELLDYNIIKTSSKDDVRMRLVSFVSLLEDIIDKYQPSVIVCERLFYSHPAKESENRSVSILSTDMVNGLIAYICGKRNIDYFTYTPTSVKKNLCGNGRAPKEDVIKVIDEKFSIISNKTNKNHICDSVAIALNHIYNLIENENEKNKQC